MIARNPPECRVERVPCCVCSGTAGREIASGRDYEYLTSSTVFRMVRCRECGHHYLNPRPALDELMTIYPPNYYAYHYTEVLHPLADAAKRTLDQRKMSVWLSHLDSAQPRVLDVGCGNGRYLKALHRRGVPKQQLWGVELDPAVVADLHANGYPAHCGRIEDLVGLPPRSFDLIVMLQVIEHVADPAACIAQLAGLLAPGGVLVLETPNARCLDRTLFRRHYWGGYHFPRHWNLFDATTLSRLLQRHGLHTRLVRYLPSPSFWIYSLHHVTRYALECPRLAGLFNPFRNVPAQALFTSLDLLRGCLGLRTSNMEVTAGWTPATPAPCKNPGGTLEPGGVAQ